MSRKIPPEAFECYLQLRSYAEVARRFGVTKRAIVKAAARERWQDRLAEVERRAKERTEERAVESIEAMNTRHLKSLRAIQGKAIEALRSHALDSAFSAVRALDLAIKHERVIRGEPGERSENRHTGVLVVPAAVTPQEWIADQREKNETRENPLLAAGG